VGLVDCHRRTQYLDVGRRRQLVHGCHVYRLDS